MENACLQCTERCHETHRVWSDHSMRACSLCISNCNLSNRVPYFFKYVTACMESTYHEPAMEIPLEFAKKHIPDSVCDVEMEGPNNTLWYVKLRCEDNLCLIQEGWDQFAESTRIIRGDALIFKLIPNRCGVRFNVKIFKRDPNSLLFPNTEPLQPQHNHHRVNFQGSKRRRVSHSPATNVKQKNIAENADMRSKVHPSMAYKPSDNYSTNPLVTNFKQNNTVDDPGMIPKGLPPMSNTKENKTHSLNRHVNNGAHETSVMKESCTEMATADQMSILKEMSNNIDSNQMTVIGKKTNASTNVTDHNSSQTKSNIRTESLPKDMDDTDASNPQQEDNFIGKTERTQRKTCEKTFPCFHKIMHLTSVNSPYIFSIPKAFADQYMHIESRVFNLVLSLAGGQKSWNANGRMSKLGIPTLDWRSFVVSNEITIHDTCVFHLVEKFKFNVEIRRGSSSSDIYARSKQQLVRTTQNPSSSDISNALSVKVKNEKM